MRSIGPVAVSVIAGLFGLALVAVIVGSGQTSGLLKSVGDTLSGLISKAVG